MKHWYYAALLCFAACQPQTDLPLTSKWYHNTGEPSQVGKAPRRDAFATYALETTAPTLTLHSTTNLQAPFLPTQGQVAVYVDGKHWRTVHLKAPSDEVTLRLDSVPAASHRVSLIAGGQICPGDTGAVQFATLTRLSVPKGSKVSPVAMPYTAGLVVWGDSRSVGGGDPLPALQAWPMRLRTTFPQTEIFTPGWGSLVFSHHIDTPEKRAALIKGIVERLKPYRKQQVWFEVGLNDYYTAACTPAQLQQLYGSLLRELHEALPLAMLYVQSDVVAHQEQANTLGFTLQQYRDAELTAASLPYVRAVDGRQLGRGEDVSVDKFHLTPAGDARFAQRAAAILAN